MGESTQIQLESELAYLESAKKDMIRDIMEERSQQRIHIQELLKIKIPQVAENELTREEQRILRSARFGGSFEEIQRAKEINEMLENIRSGCYGKYSYNLKRVKANGELFTFTIPGIDKTFCVNVRDVLIHGMFNEDLGLADVDITLSTFRSDIPDSRSSLRFDSSTAVKTDEVYHYPLNEEDSKALLNKAMTIVTPDLYKYPQIVYPGLDEYRSEIAVTELKLRELSKQRELKEMRRIQIEQERQERELEQFRQQRELDQQRELEQLREMEQLRKEHEVEEQLRLLRLSEQKQSQIEERRRQRELVKQQRQREFEEMQRLQAEKQRQELAELRTKQAQEELIAEREYRYVQNELAKIRQKREADQQRQNELIRSQQIQIQQQRELDELRRIQASRFYNH